MRQTFDKELRLAHSHLMAASKALRLEYMQGGVSNPGWKEQLSGLIEKVEVLAENLDVKVGK